MLHTLGYDGPVGLGTDDTAIEPALGPFLAPDGAWLILGGSNGPITAREAPPSPSTTKASSTSAEAALDVNTTADLLRSHAIPRADKARIVVLLIPIPKVSLHLPVCSAVRLLIASSH